MRFKAARAAAHSGKTKLICDLLFLRSDTLCKVHIYTVQIALPWLPVREPQEQGTECISDDIQHLVPLCVTNSHSERKWKSPRVINKPNGRKKWPHFVFGLLSFGRPCLANEKIISTLHRHQFLHLQFPFFFSMGLLLQTQPMIYADEVISPPVWTVRPPDP